MQQQILSIGTEAQIDHLNRGIQRIHVGEVFDLIASVILTCLVERQHIYTVTIRQLTGIHNISFAAVGVKGKVAFGIG